MMTTKSSYSLNASSQADLLIFMDGSINLDIIGSYEFRVELTANLNMTGIIRRTISDESSGSAKTKIFYVDIPSYFPQLTIKVTQRQVQ
jgi:hypothetical protein